MDEGRDPTLHVVCQFCANAAFAVVLVGGWTAGLRGAGLAVASAIVGCVAHTAADLARPDGRVHDARWLRAQVTSNLGFGTVMALVVTTVLDGIAR
jgi:hypothetical protein